MSVVNFCSNTATRSQSVQRLSTCLAGAVPIGAG